MAKKHDSSMPFALSSGFGTSVGVSSTVAKLNAMLNLKNLV